MSSSDEFLCRERFAQKILSSSEKTGDSILLTSLRRNENQRDVLSSFVASDSFEKSETVELGHGDIPERFEKDERAESQRRFPVSTRNSIGFAASRRPRARRFIQLGFLRAWLFPGETREGGQKKEGLNEMIRSGGDAMAKARASSPFEAAMTLQ